MNDYLRKVEEVRQRITDDTPLAQLVDACADLHSAAGWIARRVEKNAEEICGGCTLGTMGLVLGVDPFDSGYSVYNTVRKSPRAPDDPDPRAMLNESTQLTASPGLREQLHKLLAPFGTVGGLRKALSDAGYETSLPTDKV